jgi:hypothetical protein
LARAKKWLPTPSGRALNGRPGLLLVHFLGRLGEPRPVLARVKALRSLSARFDQLRWQGLQHGLRSGRRAFHAPPGIRSTRLQLRLIRSCRSCSTGGPLLESRGGSFLESAEALAASTRVGQLQLGPLDHAPSPDRSHGERAGRIVIKWRRPLPAPCPPGPHGRRRRGRHGQPKPPCESALSPCLEEAAPGSALVRMPW